MKLKVDQLIQQKIIIFTICLSICLPTLVNLVNVNVNRMVSSRFIWDTAIIYGILILFLLLSLSISLKKRKIDFVLLLGIFIILFLISYLVFPANRTYMFTTFTDFSLNSFYRLFFYCIPLYLLLRNILDYNLMFKYLLYTARIMVLSGILTYLLFMLKGGFEIQYMVFAYDILFGVVVCLYDYLKNRKLVSLLLGLLGFAVIVIGGARGPLICLIFFILLYIVLNVRKNKLRTWIIISAFSVLLIYMSNNFTMLANNTNNLINQFGLKSRTLELIIHNEFFNQSGRDIIQNILLQHIWEKPLFGYGMFGDRYVTESISSVAQGTYAHTRYSSH